MSVEKVACKTCKGVTPIAIPPPRGGSKDGLVQKHWKCNYPNCRRTNVASFCHVSSDDLIHDMEDAGASMREPGSFPTLAYMGRSYTKSRAFKGRRVRFLDTNNLNAMLRGLALLVDKEEKDGFKLDVFQTNGKTGPYDDRETLVVNKWGWYYYTMHEKYPLQHQDRATTDTIFEPGLFTVIHPGFMKRYEPKDLNNYFGFNIADVPQEAPVPPLGTLPLVQPILLESAVPIARIPPAQGDEVYMVVR